MYTYIVYILLVFVIWVIIWYIIFYENRKSVICVCFCLVLELFLVKLPKILSAVILQNTPDQKPY
jgi:hypothetical protein